MDEAPQGANHMMFAVMDNLQCLGVNVVDGNRFATSLTKNKTSFVEVYGRGRIVEAANEKYAELRIDGLDALDLRSGNWDFSKKEDREQAIHLIRTKKPRWLILSTPCITFSQFKQNSSFA